MARFFEKSLVKYQKMSWTSNYSSLLVRRALQSTGFGLSFIVLLLRNLMLPVNNLVSILFLFFNQKSLLAKKKTAPIDNWGVFDVFPNYRTYRYRSSSFGGIRLSYACMLAPIWQFLQFLFKITCMYRVLDHFMCRNRR